MAKGIFLKEEIGFKPKKNKATQAKAPKNKNEKGCTVVKKK